MIGTAIALAQFVPDIIDLFGSKGGSKVEQTISVINGIAEQITGESGDTAVKALQADPELAYKFKIAVMEDTHVKDRLNAEDRKNARDMYKSGGDQADKIAQSVIRWNLWFVSLLVLVNISAVYFLKDNGTLIAIVSNIVGVVIGNLLNERQSVIGFFFGSSLGSKMKSISKDGTHV